MAEGADAAAMTRSVPLDKCLDDALVVYSQNGERAASRAGLPAAPAAAGLRRQHERQVAAPAQGDRRAGRFARGNVEVHRPAAQRQGARVHVLHGGEVDHHVAFGRPEDSGRGLRRDPRHRVERPRQGRARRRLGRRRQDVDAGGAAGAGADALADALPVSVAVERTASGDREPSRRRDGIRAASFRATRR